VLNEAIEPRDGLPGDLRGALLYKIFGESYIAESFRAARAADHDAALYYNDYGVDYAEPESRIRRRAILKLLSSLKAKGVPLDGLGIQGHLRVGRKFNPDEFRTFLRDVAALGLHIVITEFDVGDRHLPPDPDLRDRLVAEHARMYLDVVLDEPAVKGVMTWGLSDKFSWLSTHPITRRSDGLRIRGLPLDEYMQPKPLWRAMAEAFDRAPLR